MRQPQEPTFAATDPLGIRRVLEDLDSPCFVVTEDGEVGLTSSASRGTVLTAAPALPADRLGARSFRELHGVRNSYMAGAMAGGISSVDMVVALAQRGALGSFGAGGLPPERVTLALAELKRRLPAQAYAVNLLHSPQEPSLEAATVQLLLDHEVRCVEASAFLTLTTSIVRYRAAGLRRGPDGRVQIGRAHV